MALVNQHGKTVQKGAMGLIMWCRDRPTEVDRRP
jgi:hypothetical protein